jgi:hypothetical protein
MRVRSLTVIFFASFWLLASIASADNIHVACVSPTTCSANPTDITLSNNPSTFEYGLKGDLSGTGSGDFFLIALVPNNEFAGFNVSITGTNTENSIVSPVDAGAFTGGGGTELNTVLDPGTGFTGVPNGHPLSSFLNATQIAGVDPTATGYEAFVYAFEDVTFGTKTNPIFSTGSMPVGTVFTALVTAEDDVNNTVTFDTPNSEGLLVAHVATVPEPRFYSLLVFGLISLGVFARRLRLQ